MTVTVPVVGTVLLLLTVVLAPTMPLFPVPSVAYASTRIRSPRLPLPGVARFSVWFVAPLIRAPLRYHW